MIDPVPVVIRPHLDAALTAFADRMPHRSAVIGYLRSRGCSTEIIAGVLRWLGFWVDDTNPTE
jgi:SOS response regulatory protein OraA/RecX